MLLESAGNAGLLAGAAMVLLTSAAQPGDEARGRQLGAAAHLTKPVPQRELREEILRALEGRSAVPSERPAAPLVRTSKPLHILVAEDNPVNQRVAWGVLQKWGHSVVVTANGREALDAIEHDCFDLVLMDVQMPVMDGCEATAAIRQREKATGGHVPILAMTAHAMKGDEQVCLEAGMDGYISKPIQRSRLFQTIEEGGWTNGLATDCEEAPQVAQGSDREVQAPENGY
jgi:CheY-like chemotaxis protein